jgi:hypothetical protein
MINSASKYPNITLKVIKFSKPETKFPQEFKLRGDIPPLNHLGGTYPPSPSGGNPERLMDSLSTGILYTVEPW